MCGCYLVRTLMMMMMMMMHQKLKRKKYSLCFGFSSNVLKNKKLSTHNVVVSLTAFFFQVLWNIMKSGSFLIFTIRWLQNWNILVQWLQHKSKVSITRSKHHLVKKKLYVSRLMIFYDLGPFSVWKEKHLWLRLRESRQTQGWLW